MKHSIRKQMAILFIGLMSFVIVANWSINNVFLESYYVSKKKNVLIDAYNYMNTVEDLEEYTGPVFRKGAADICATNNISMLITDGDFKPVFGDVEERVALESKLLGFVFDVGDSKAEILEETEKYTIQKAKAFQQKTDYLEMWGVLDADYFFIMRIPIQGIRENVKISNEFLSYFSAIGLTLSVILIWWIAKKITDPIQKLTVLSQQMTELDFDAKYISTGKNELDLLGEHFNQMSETLETTISELKTANNELQKDIEKKEQIDEMRKEFLANVSHELKTPIALIQGYAEGLKENINDDEESRDFYCEVIMDEASKMNQMVKKLLTLNQLEFGNDTVAMERFDITSMVEGVLQSADILAKQKGASILLQQKEPVYVWADEFKVEEVVTNYVSNALNHVDHEKVIDVKIQSLGDKVRVSVFNTGNPIPEEDLDNIWIKFYKVDKARTREYGGSGIGLSIVKAIMESFNQQFGVRNYDNGVEFWFELDSGEK